MHSDAPFVAVIGGVHRGVEATLDVSADLAVAVRSTKGSKAPYLLTSIAAAIAVAFAEIR